ncbi:MAG: xanthine dehydrogenase family protein molybdopterin-binding subunit [Pseudomonadota bacterium]
MSSKPDRDSAVALSRREFLVSSGAVGGGLVLGFALPAWSAAPAGPPPGPPPPPPLVPQAFIAIGTDEMVTITVPVVEMGQGPYTSVPMLIAEELGIELARVRVAHAPVGPVYGNPGLGGQQATGASSSMRGLYVPMRRAGAAMRMMLVSTAARGWKVPATECEAGEGRVLHRASGRTATYGSLAARAVKEPVPTGIVLKDNAQFRLIGTPTRRLDIAGKVDGSAVFGIDAVIPGMKLAGVIACPVFGGKVASVDDSKARAIRGVQQVIVLPDAVAVVADHTGAVRKALAALVIRWDGGPNAEFSTARWREQLVTAAKGKGGVAVDKGDARKVIAGSKHAFNATYDAPALAHAPMEPMNCTVRLTATTCELWTGTQAPARVQGDVAHLLGFRPEQVTVNNSMLGGGFGRRLESDFAVQAVRIAREAKVPLKLIWSREEDMRHDWYRPFYYDELAAAFDDHGKPLAFSHRIVGSSIIARLAGGNFKGIDSDAVDAAQSPYDFPARYVEYVPSESPVPTGFFRGVGPNHNVTVIEGFIDEVADKLGKDPVEFRRGLLTNNPRLGAVMEKVATGIGWGKSLPRGQGMGIAVVNAWESFMALALQVEADGDGRIRLRRIVAAIDCGQPINPDGIAAQVQSGVVFGLTSALYGRITVSNGRVMQSNFHDYPMLRMNEVPQFDVHVIPSTEKPGGIGEIGATLPAPALLNAIFSATGKRIRQLPLDPAQIIES